jgi:hypothetical protein
MVTKLRSILSFRREERELADNLPVDINEPQT